MERSLHTRSSRLGGDLYSSYDDNSPDSLVLGFHKRYYRGGKIIKIVMALQLIFFSMTGYQLSEYQERMVQERAFHTTAIMLLSLPMSTLSEIKV